MSYWQKLSRREALSRMGILASTVVASPSTLSMDSAAWPAATSVPQVSASGYGTDPVLSPPEASPWPRILSKSQLQSLADLSEFVCPGSVEAGVVDVLNEWLSAPYPDQTSDRELILPGLNWLQSLAPPSLAGFFQQIDQTGARSVQLRFLARVRILVTGAYFSSPQGVKELGYVGNRPIAGDYPGPSDAALSHLNRLLDDLGLEL